MEKVAKESYYIMYNILCKLESLAIFESLKISSAIADVIIEPLGSHVYYTLALNYKINFTITENICRNRSTKYILTDNEVPTDYQPKNLSYYQVILVLTTVQISTRYNVPLSSHELLKLVNWISMEVRSSLMHLK